MFQQVCAYSFHPYLALSSYHWIPNELKRISFISVWDEWDEIVYASQVMNFTQANVFCRNSKREEMLQKLIEIYWTFLVYFLLELVKDNSKNFKGLISTSLISHVLCGHLWSTTILPRNMLEQNPFSPTPEAAVSSKNARNGRPIILKISKRESKKFSFIARCYSQLLEKDLRRSLVKPQKTN